MNVTPVGDDPGVSTQLRLVDTPAARRTKRAAPRKRAAIAAAARSRKAHWNVDWHLDARTRQRGQQGVAAAKAALERAGRPDAPLSKAS
jgi:hypothetical protein